MPYFAQRRHIVQFNLPAWSYWSIPGNWWLWYRLHMFPAYHSQSPNWQSQQPKTFHCDLGWKGLRCHLGRSPSHLQGIQHKTYYLSDQVHRFFSPSSKWLKNCILHHPPKAAAHISVYLLKFALRLFLWGQTPTPIWKQTKRRELWWLYWQKTGKSVSPVKNMVGYKRCHITHHKNKGHKLLSSVWSITNCCLVVVSLPHQASIICGALCW